MLSTANLVWGKAQNKWVWNEKRDALHSFGYQIRRDVLCTNWSSKPWRAEFHAPDLAHSYSVLKCIWSHAIWCQHRCLKANVCRMTPLLTTIRVWWLRSLCMRIGSPIWLPARMRCGSIASNRFGKKSAPISCASVLYRNVFFIGLLKIIVIT